MRWTLVRTQCAAIAASVALLCIAASSVRAASLYAATSQPGEVWRRTGDTRWTKVSRQLGSAVLCLAEYNGALYAGTVSASGGGQVYRSTGNSWALVGSSLDSAVCSMAVYQGSLYAGTSGNGGRLYRFDGVGSWSLVVDEQGWAGVRALYAASDGWLYLGDIGCDKIGRFDGSIWYYLVYLGGSCILE